MTRPHVTLLGPQRVGKSTVGALLAERADLSHRDGDAALEALTGATAAEIADRDGIGALHDREAAVARSLLADDDPAVVTPAASVLDDPTTMDAVRSRSWLVVVLEASPEVLVARPASGHRRPMGTEELRRTWERRRPAALAAADLVLDATETPERLADRVTASRAC